MKIQPVGNSDKFVKREIEKSQENYLLTIKDIEKQAKLCQ